MRYQRSLFVLFGASLLFACETGPVKDAIALQDLDKEWIDLNQKRLGSTSGDRAALNDQLAKLSERAEQRGNATSDADAATAAGFYRIASMSALAAGPPRNTQVLMLSNKGSGVCAKLSTDPAAQPRDCAFVRVAPGLATLHQQAAEVKTLLDAGATLDGANLATAKRVADTTTKSIRRVIQDRPAPAVQSKTFDDYIEVNLNSAFCTLQGLAGRPSSSSQSELQPLLDSFAAAKSALQGANISTQCSS